MSQTGTIFDLVKPMGAQEAPGSSPAAAAPASAPVASPAGKTGTIFDQVRPMGALPADQEQASAPKAHPLVDEFAKSFGYSGGDIGLGDFLTQTAGNLADATKSAFREAQGVTGEAGKPLLGSPFAAALTAPNLLAHGVEGVASLFEEGTPMLVKGLKSGDQESAYRGLGKLFAGLAQMGMMKDEPTKTGPGLLEKAAEYDPKSLQETKDATGKTRPLNVLQGSINRSIGALVRDVRYGDPSKALVDNGIKNPSIGGRLHAIADRLTTLKPQLNEVLANSKGQVDIVATLDPIIQKATQAINESFESPEAKMAAHHDVNALWMNALRMAPNGAVDNFAANEIKQGIGDAVNWEKRPTPMMPFAEDAYRDAYSALKRAVNANVPEAAALNENITNLLAAKNALTNAFLGKTAGTGPMAGFGLARQAEALVGKVAPAVIRGAQAIPKASSVAAQVGKETGGGVASAAGTKRATQSEQDDIGRGARRVLSGQ